MKKFGAVLLAFCIITGLLPAAGTADTIGPATEAARDFSDLECQAQVDAVMAELIAADTPTPNTVVGDPDVMRNPMMDNIVPDAASENAVTAADTAAEEAAAGVQAAATAAGGEGFTVNPVNMPFNVLHNKNESVSLLTGALQYEKTFLSLPGRNGLDVDFTIKYNSDDSVLSQNQFDAYADTKQENFYNFAIGWSFGFDTIIKVQSKYGYKRSLTLNLADGGAYEISGDRSTGLTEDLELTIKGYYLNDLQLIHEAATKDYVLTYRNGTVKRFDDEYGVLKSITDRFGNTVTFSYTQIPYYRGTFINYFTSPAVYFQTLYALSGITDSAGREISVQYHYENVWDGTQINEIQVFLKENNVWNRYGTIHLQAKEDSHGQVVCVDEISDAENLKTTFQYGNEVMHHFQNGSDAYTISGSAYAMSDIQYPTGGSVHYDYEKARRSYRLPSTSINSGYYDVLRVSRSENSGGAVHAYAYETDYSGYPYGNPNNVSGNGDKLVNADRHHTIVTTYTDAACQNGSQTVYTFDNSHNLIREQTYDLKKSRNGYVPGYGSTDRHLVIGNDLYRFNLDDNRRLIGYRQTPDGACTFLMPVQLDKSTYTQIGCIRAVGDCIYVFCSTTTSSKSRYTHSVKIYDINTNTWSDGASFTTTTVKAAALSMSYNGTMFYGSYRNNSYLYYVCYNPQTNAWTEQNVYNSRMDSGSIYRLGTDGAHVYYANQQRLEIYDIASNTFSYKSLSLSSYGITMGVTANNCVYMLGDDGVYIYDIAADTLSTVYSYPFDTSSYDQIQTGADGCIYYLQIPSNRAASQRLYKFDMQARVWILVTHRLFDNQRGTLLVGTDCAYFNANVAPGSYQGDIESGMERFDLTASVAPAGADNCEAYV